MENVCPGQICRLAEPVVGRTKLLRFWINGDTSEQCYELYINPNSLRTWNSILVYLTSIMRPKFGAIRKIVRYSTKENVTCFDDFIPGEKYIVLPSYGKVKEVQHGYMTPSEFEIYWLKKNPVQRFYSGELPSRTTADFLMKTMMKRRTVTYVLVNGVQHQTPKKLVLCPRDMVEWEETLKFLSEKLDIPDGIRYLCTIFGDPVVSPYELQHGYVYVAVPFTETFKQMDYMGPVRKHRSSCVLQIQSSTTNVGMSKYSKLTFNVRKRSRKKSTRKGSPKNSSRPSTGKRKPTGGGGFGNLYSSKLSGGGGVLKNNYPLRNSSPDPIFDKTETTDGDLDEEESVLEGSTALTIETTDSILQGDKVIQDNDYIKVGSRIFKRSEKPCFNCVKAQEVVCLHYIGSDIENSFSCCLNPVTNQNDQNTRNYEGSSVNYNNISDKLQTKTLASFQYPQVFGSQMTRNGSWISGNDKPGNLKDPSNAGCSSKAGRVSYSYSMKNKKNFSSSQSRKPSSAKSSRTQKPYSGCPPDCIYVQKSMNKKKLKKKNKSPANTFPESTLSATTEKYPTKTACPTTCRTEACGEKTYSDIRNSHQDNVPTNYISEIENRKASKISKISFNKVRNEETDKRKSTGKRDSRPSSASSRESSSGRNIKKGRSQQASVIKSDARRPTSPYSKEPSFSRNRESAISKPATKRNAERVTKDTRRPTSASSADRSSNLRRGLQLRESGRSISTSNPSISVSQRRVETFNTVIRNSEVRGTQTNLYVVCNDVGCSGMPKIESISRGHDPITTESISHAREKHMPSISAKVMGSIIPDTHKSIISESGQRFESGSSVTKPVGYLDKEIVSKYSIKSAGTQGSIRSNRETIDGLSKKSVAKTSNAKQSMLSKREPAPEERSYASVKSKPVVSEDEKIVSKYSTGSAGTQDISNIRSKRETIDARSKQSVAETSTAKQSISNIEPSTGITSQPSASADKEIVAKYSIRSVATQDMSAEPSTTKKMSVENKETYPSKASFASSISQRPSKYPRGHSFSIASNKLSMTEKESTLGEIIPDIMDQQTQTSNTKQSLISKKSKLDSSIKSTVTDDHTLKSSEDKNNMTESTLGNTADSISMTEKPRKVTKEVATADTVSDKRLGTSVRSMETASIKLQKDQQRDDKSVSILQSIAEVDRGMTTSNLDKISVETTTTVEAALKDLMRDKSVGVRESTLDRHLTNISNSRGLRVEAKVGESSVSGVKTNSISTGVDKRITTTSICNQRIQRNGTVHEDLAGSIGPDRQSTKVSTIGEQTIQEKVTPLGEAESFSIDGSFIGPGIRRKTLSIGKQSVTFVDTDLDDQKPTTTKAVIERINGKISSGEKAKKSLIPARGKIPTDKDDVQVVPKTELPAISLQTCLKEIQVMNRMDIKVVSGTSSEHFFTITCNKCFKRTGSSSTLECVPCNVTEQEIEQGSMNYEEGNGKSSTTKTQTEKETQKSEKSDGHSTTTRSIGSVTRSHQTTADPEARGDEKNNGLDKIIVSIT